jgi:hypothetical protein
MRVNFLETFKSSCVVLSDKYLLDKSLWHRSDAIRASELIANKSRISFIILNLNKLHLF